MTSLQQQIDLFFRHPNDFTGSIGAHSTLYLLRRDTLTCFGHDPNTNAKINFKALWPGTMGVMAGIDLLAKFVYGDSTGVGTRFRNYIIKYIDATNAEIIYQLRNAMMHSFGLYSSDTKGNVFRFVLNPNVEQMVVQHNSNVYIVNIIILRQLFEQSIYTYKEELQQSEKLQENFVKMFVKYGGVIIG